MPTAEYFTVVADFKTLVGQSVRGTVTFTPVLGSGDAILATNFEPRPTALVPQTVTGRIDSDGRLKLRTKPDGVREEAEAFPTVGIPSKYYVSTVTGLYYRYTPSGYVEILPYEPVKLLANTALLELAEPLYYQVSFSGITVGDVRTPTKLRPFTFEAPTAGGVTVNLVEVGRAPGQPPTGITKIAPGAVRVVDGNKLQFSFGGVDIPEAVDVNVTADTIEDAGAVGKTVVRSESYEDVWSALGQVPTANLPGAVDSVLEFPTVGDFPAVGETSRIYVDLSTNSTYRWGGTTYVRLSGNTISADITDSTATGRSVLTAANAAAARAAIGAGTSSLALGTTSSTAKAGDYQPAAANISDSTATGRALITAANAAAARTTLESLRNRPGWFDVRDYGGVGDGVTNDRTAINAAITAAAAGGAGGTVFIPRGVWAIAETGTGFTYVNFNDTRGQNIILQGEGCGSPINANFPGGTTIKGNTAWGPIIRWNDNQGFSLRDLRIVGSGGTTAQNGIQMDKTANPTNLAMEIRNVNIFNCGGSGFYSNSPVVFNFSNIHSSGNGVHGFHIFGGNLGTFSGCWATNNPQNGWYLDRVGYSHFVSCGADGNGTGWYLNQCNNAILTGTGSEANLVDAMVIDGSWGVCVDGIGMYDNNRYGIWVKGDSRAVRLSSVREVPKSGGGAIYSIYTQTSFSPVYIQGYVCTTPTNIAPTDTELNGGNLRTRSVNAIGINARTGSYTLVAGDAGLHVTMTNANPITLTVPTNASVPFPTGTRIRLSQLGAGQVTVAGASGVTVNATPGLKISAQYAAAELVKVGTDTWLLTGSLSA